MKCMICSVVERKDKFLSSKLDTLHKHVGWKKNNYYFYWNYCWGLV